MSPPPCSPNRVRMERDAPSPEPIVYSFICVRRSPQLKSPPTKMGKTCGHRPRSPTRTEGLHTVGCGLIPQGLSRLVCNAFDRLPGRWVYTAYWSRKHVMKQFTALTPVCTVGLFCITVISDNQYISISSMQQCISALKYREVLIWKCYTWH